jgi:hypothetical protein
MPRLHAAWQFTALGKQRSAHDGGIVLALPQSRLLNLLLYCLPGASIHLYLQ